METRWGWTYFNPPSLLSNLALSKTDISSLWLFGFVQQTMKSFEEMSDKKLVGDGPRTGVPMEGYLLFKSATAKEKVKFSLKGWSLKKINLPSHKRGEIKYYNDLCNFFYGFVTWYKLHKIWTSDPFLLFSWFRPLLVQKVVWMLILNI